MSNVDNRSDGVPGYQAGRTLSRHLAGNICIVWVLLLAGIAWTASASSPTEDESQRPHAQADLAHGAELFVTCAACHRPDGSGADDGTVPAIAAQPFRVVAKELVDFRYDKRWDERMQHFSDRHHLNGPQDVVDVAAYVSRLPPTPALGWGPGVLVEQGRRVYARSCAACHGPAADGSDASMSPRLAGQHYQYLLRQISDAIAGRRPNFTDAHIALLKKLDQNELNGVADYLSRLGPQRPP
jgi:cytochrome c553